MVSAVVADAPPPPIRRSAGGSWARLFGYDIFISFALGPPPRGARGYASDLARRLRERGFTVFFSEDEAPAGGELDETLKGALRASRVLVVVANRGTLREPRWVRSEVEEFRRRYPKRTVVPISIDGALQDSELGPATQTWLPFAERIWIDESREAGEAGFVSDEVVDRLVTAPHAVRSATRLRAVVGGIIVFFAVIAAVALWQKRAADLNAVEAQRQRGQAQEQRTVAELQARRADAAASQARAAASAAEAARQQEREARIAEQRQRELAEERLRLAQSRELAVSAGAALASTGPERAVLLAAAGLELSPSVESESALRAALLEPRGHRVLQRSVGNAWGIAYTPDGSHLLSIGADGAAITDLATGKSARSLGGHGLRLVSVSADGRYAVVGAEDGNSRIWRLGVGAQEAREVELGQARRRTVLSADARLAVTFGEGDCAQLWLVATRIQLAELCGHQGSVHSAAFNPSGTALMSSSDDAVVRVWDTDTGRMVQELKAPSSRARLSFSPDGRLAGAVSTVSSMVQLWDARSWKAGATIRPDFSLLDAVFSPDGDRVVLLDSLGFKAQLFSTRDGQAMAPLVGHTDRIFGAAFSADGEFLVTASADKTARVWAGRRGNPVAVLRGHEDVVTSARFSPDGTRIATSSLDGSSRIWQSILFSDVVDLNRSGPRIESTSLGRGERLAWFVDSAREVKMLSLADRTLRPVASVPRKFVFLAMSGDRRIIATSDGAGSILVRRTGDGSTLAEWPGAHAVAPRLAVSPDGTRLVSAGGSGVLWDLQRKKIITTLDVQASASDAVFSPDGRFFVTLEGDAALLRESGRGRRVAVLAGEPEYEVTSARFSPDGGDIVTTSVDKVVRIWRTGASSPRLQLVGHTDAVRGAWFSADGQSIVSVGQDRTARVWDVATGHMVAELPGDRDDWATASFHPHEALVITSGGHNPATLWDARTGRRLMEFNRAADAEADFTTDGKHVVVVSDGRARLYRCEECGQGRDLLRIARVRADRALSTEERRVFLHEAVKLAPSGQQMRAPLTGNR